VKTSFDAPKVKEALAHFSPRPPFYHLPPGRPSSYGARRAWRGTFSNGPRHSFFFLFWGPLLFCVTAPLPPVDPSSLPSRVFPLGNVAHTFLSSSSSFFRSCIADVGLEVRFFVPSGSSLILLIFWCEIFCLSSPQHPHALLSPFFQSPLAIGRLFSCHSSQPLMITSRLPFPFYSEVNLHAPDLPSSQHHPIPFFVGRDFPLSKETSLPPRHLPLLSSSLYALSTQWSGLPPASFPPDSPVPFVFPLNFVFFKAASRLRCLPGVHSCSGRK